MAFFSWGKQSLVGKVSTPNPPLLFTPFKVKNLELKNRIVVSPMCQYSSKDGFFNDWHMTHLGSFAVGGAGLIIVEATAVEDIGRITPFDAGIWKDEQINKLKDIVDFVHGQNGKIGIQLAHAGRKASSNAPWINKGGNIPVSEGGWIPIGPSPVAFSKHYVVPNEMTKDDINRVVDRFYEAALRAEKAGVDIIEIHGAHGYLISSFNSPLSNQRKDEFGGDYEGRTKFCKLIIKAVKSAFPSKPLFLRLSCSDWVPGGWTSEETVRLAKEAKELGVDVIDCSSGGNSPLQKIDVGPGYQVKFSEAIKKAYGDEIKTIAVGAISEPQQAEDIIKEGKADLVAMAREFLREPRWPLKAANYFKVDAAWTSQYERAKL